MLEKILTRCFGLENNGLQMFDLGVSGVRIRFLFGLDGVDPIEM